MKKTSAKDGHPETVILKWYTHHLRRYENGNQINIWCPLIEGICQPDIYYQVIFIRTLWLESEITMRKLGLKSHHLRE